MIVVEIKSGILVRVTPEYATQHGLKEYVPPVKEAKFKNKKVSASVSKPVVEEVKHEEPSIEVKMVAEGE